MTSPIETNNVVERLRRRTAPVMGGAGLYEVVLDERPDALCAEAADEIERLRSENQSLSDRIDVLEGEKAALRDDIVAILRGELPHASLTQGGKTNV